MAQQTSKLSSELRFSNKAQWLTFLNEYQECNKQTFTTRTTKYLHQVKLKGNCNTDLELYSADYKCLKHGIYESKGKGKKKSTSVKTNCPAEMKLRLTPCRQFLYVKSFNEHHNHPQMGIPDDADNITAEGAVSVPDEHVCSEPAVSAQNEITNGPSKVVETEKEVMELTVVSNFCRIVSINAEGHHTTASTSAAVPISNIVLPKKVETKGRPPGRATTAIGLPIKKKKKTINFEDKTPVDQVKTLIQLILPSDHVENVICGEYLVQIKDVPMDAGGIPDAFVHESVNLNALEIYFEKCAFKKLRELISIKTEKQIFVCRACQVELTAASSCVLCDSCLCWFHFGCDTYNEKKAPKHWYCKYCRL